MRKQFETVLKAPAKVLGCLCSGFIRVIALPGSGLADGGIPKDVPINLIPIDLRMPNSEFMLVMDVTTGRFIRVERRGDDGGSQDGLTGDVGN